MKKISVLLLCAIVLVAVDASAWSGRSGWNVFSRWLSNQQARDPDFRRYPSGLTFYKDFSIGEGTDVNALTADFALGSPVATFTASRGASNPATYIDSSGVIQQTTTSNVPRFSKGFYDTTGFVERAGVYEEGAATNYLIRTTFDTDAGAGMATGWDDSDGVTGAPTYSLVAETLTNISGSQAQRMVYDTDTAENFIQFVSDNTAVGSLSQNDTVTFSAYMKGTVTSARLRLRVLEADAAGATGTSHFSSALTITEDWARYTYTVQLTDADLSRATARFYFDEIVNASDIDIQFACVQLEVTLYATTFIPTTTAALTRNGESLKYVILNNRTAATESCVAKINVTSDSNSAGYDVVSGTDTKRRIFRFATSTNDIQLFGNADDSGGSSVLDVINAAWTAHTDMVLGYSMQSTGNPNIAGYFQGLASGTNTNTDFTSPVWGTYFWVGSENSGTSQLNGIIQKIGFWNRVLTASEHASVDGLMD